MRNSVKAVVDVYNGDVDLYVFEPDDPLIKVWKRIFPGLFRPLDDMPAAIREHVRYPSDILLVQGLVYAKYHMDDPAVFYNQEDLWVRATEAGLDALVAGPEKDRVYKSKHDYPVTADAAFEEIEPDSVKILVIPGGYAPDRLRRHEACLELVRSVWKAGGVVAAICHAGWVLASAGIADGRRLTSFSAIRDDLINAGANWVDEPCVTDGKLVTAQTPNDLPDFMKAILSQVSK